MKKTLLTLLIFGMFCAVFAGGNRTNMSEYLGLNAEQERQMADLRAFCRTEDSVYFAELGELRKKLFVEAGKDNPDMEKINEIAEKIGNQHSLLALCLVKQIQEVKKILTKEQFEKFIEFRQNRNRNANPRQSRNNQK